MALSHITRNTPLRSGFAKSTSVRSWRLSSASRPFTTSGSNAEPPEGAVARQDMPDTFPPHSLLPVGGLSFPRPSIIVEETKPVLPHRLKQLRRVEQRPQAMPINIPDPVDLMKEKIEKVKIISTETQQENIPPQLRPNHPYWQALEPWKDVDVASFLDYRWQVKNTIQTVPKLYQFLESVLPETIPQGEGLPRLTREQFISDVVEGIEVSTMAVRLTPHILSVINWSDAYRDPVRKQFIPVKSTWKPDHPGLELDSLHETADSPTPGLVHRYPDKALFLATSVCPVYCRFCTRSYSVGTPTTNVQKNPFKPTRKRWEAMFDYIQRTTQLQDIVVSGGDSFYLQPESIIEIGQRLLSIPHIKRIRFASKGLAVCPSRILDPKDNWTDALLQVSREARKMGKSVALHTHFNSPQEITWVTKQAAQKLYEEYLVVRNQTVLLKGVNDSVETMGKLIRNIADMNIQPYYIYQCDMVKGTEELRTPLSSLLNIEKHLRGSIAGFMMPQFVVDLPGGGGKRLANSFESYEKGVSKFQAPAIKDNGKADKIYEYHDPQ